MKIEDVKIGSELFVYVRRGRGGHGAYITVTKINRKSFVGVETDRSYSPKTPWKIHKEAKFAIVERNPGQPWMRYWFNE